MTMMLEASAPRPPAPPALLLAPLRSERPGDRRADRRDRHGLALSELYTSRDDLAGISPVADVLVEDLLWSV